MPFKFKSEFDIIDSFIKKINHNNIICSAGDDCAVIKYTDRIYQIITTDMMVENVHFSLKWQTPYQIGCKLVESNVSDIVAMGGIPKYSFLSMSIKKDEEFLKAFFKGIYDSAEKYNILLLGGDTVKGDNYVFNLALTGEVEKELLCLRSSAQSGDLICVTGSLGGSAAGLNLLEADINGNTDKYKNPCSRAPEEGRMIAEYANAMIDISDGLSGEIIHICTDSRKGAYLNYEDIPVSESTCQSAELLKKDPVDFALYGGEDYELLFTIKPENISKLRKIFTDFTETGIITEEKEGIYLKKDNKKIKLEYGFDHFKK